MKRHMENGLDIMEVGVHNDEVARNNREVIVATMRAHGMPVEGVREDYKSYPPVDIGDPE